MAERRPVLLIQRQLELKMLDHPSVLLSKAPLTWDNETVWLPPPVALITLHATVYESLVSATVLYP